MNFESTLEKFEDNLWDYHIKVPQKIVLIIKEQNMKRFLCSLNNGKSFHSSLISAGDGDFFIIINKALRSKYNLIVGSPVMVSISVDDSKYGMPLPDEMQELFNQDPEGDYYFHQLSPGKQRSLLYLVGKVKNSDKRIEKSFIILEHLKEYQGHLDYKILNSDFKNKKGLF